MIFGACQDEIGILTGAYIAIVRGMCGVKLVDRMTATSSAGTAVGELLLGFQDVAFLLSSYFFTTFIKNCGKG